MRETFWLDGINARDIGIKLQKPISVGGREPIVSTTQIEGRNGTLVRTTGTYKNMTATAVCYALERENVSRRITQIRSFLLRNHGYRRLVLSTDPEHYLMARVTNGPNIDDRMRHLNPFTIKFDCKPQFFLADGELPIEITATNTVIDNPFGGVALPLIVIAGSGAGQIAVGDYEVDILDMNDFITLDCETQNAYNEGVRMNDKISAEQFPKLDYGESLIQFSGGVTGLTIIPRWWD